VRRGLFSNANGEGSTKDEEHAESRKSDVDLRDKAGGKEKKASSDETDESGNEKDTTSRGKVRSMSDVDGQSMQQVIDALTIAMDLQSQKSPRSNRSTPFTSPTPQMKIAKRATSPMVGRATVALWGNTPRNTPLNTPRGTTPRSLAAVAAPIEPLSHLPQKLSSVPQGGEENLVQRGGGEVGGFGRELSPRGIRCVTHTVMTVNSQSRAGGNSEA
jgi:hypothetical protein